MVAVGVDTMDALEAYVEAYKNDTKPSIFHSFATMLASQSRDIHAHRQAVKKGSIDRLCDRLNLQHERTRALTGTA